MVFLSNFPCWVYFFLYKIIHFPFLPHRYPLMASPFISPSHWEYKAVSSTDDKSQADCSCFVPLCGETCGCPAGCPLLEADEPDRGLGAESCSLLGLGPYQNGPLFLCLCLWARRQWVISSQHLPAIFETRWDSGFPFLADFPLL